MHYNYYVSRVCVRSEHCIGFLKGRWSSLQGLRILINTPDHIQFVCLWIISCIVLHSFAMDYEIGRDLTTDEFFQEGMRLMEDERIQRGNHLPSKEAHVSDTDHAHEASHDIKLLEGRLVRERLKRSLMSAIEGY